MNFYRFLPVAISAMFLLLARPASASQCADLTDQERDLHTRLYQHSQFVETAYGDNPSYICLNQDNTPLVARSQHHPKLLEFADVEGQWLPEFRERWRQGNPPTDVGQYDGDNGVTYLTCSYDNFDPQFALTWATTTFDALGSDQTTLPVIVFNPLILVVAPAGLIPQGEEMGVVNLSRVPSMAGQPDELVGFQGTDITRIPQIVSSLNDLMSNSCVFEMAAIVSSVVSTQMCEGQYSVVGHSLGGAAVQHVVRDFNMNPHRDPSRRSTDLATCENVRFMGYAFN